MQDQNKTFDNPHTLQESHSQNPFDQARENQDFQREYDNAQEFYRKRPFVERFKKYLPWVKSLQGIGHLFSALSLGAGGIFTVYNYLFSDNEISDFQTWLFVGIGVVIFILVVIAIEAGKGHFLAAAMKNKFEAANQLLGEKVKPSLRKWAFALVALSLIGSVFFGMMGTYYLATEKVVIDNSYQVSREDAKAKASQADIDTKAHFQKQIESKYAQITEANEDIRNSCTSCYTMRRKIREQIATLQHDISALEAKQRAALKDNANSHTAVLAELEKLNDDTLQQDSQKAMGRGWILGVLTFCSDLMIVFCVWFIALYNDRLFREGKHIGAISEDRIPQLSLQTIYINDVYEKFAKFHEITRQNIEADTHRKLMPQNGITQKQKKKKKKKKTEEKPARNPIGFNQQPTGKSDTKMDAKKQAKEPAKKHAKMEAKEHAKSGTKIPSRKGENSPNFARSEGANYFLNLNPETPYNLGKKYNLSKAQKQKINTVRKALLKHTKEHAKRPLLSELANRVNMQPRTVKKYIEMMEKEGQKLLRQRGESM